MADSVLITFPESSLAEANQSAGSLGLAVRDADRNASVSTPRDNPDSQDGGATLAIILGSAAIGSIAKGISSWIARHSGTTVRIHSRDGTSVDIKFASGQDTAQIVRAALEKN